MSTTSSSDEGENVSFMSREPVQVSPLSPTDSRVIIERFSALIDGPADQPAEAINKLFPTATDRTSDKLIYDPTDLTLGPEGSAHSRELKDYCGDGVKPFGTDYNDQIVPGVLGPVYTVPIVTPPISPPITPVTEITEKETPIPPSTPPRTPPISSPPASLPVTPPVNSPPISPPISSWASSTSSTSARKISPPLPSPIYSPPLVSDPPLPAAYSPATRSAVSGEITPPISPIVVSPPTPPSVKAAQTSYFPPVFP